MCVWGCTDVYTLNTHARSYSITPDINYRNRNTHTQSNVLYVSTPIHYAFNVVAAVFEANALRTHVRTRRACTARSVDFKWKSLLTQLRYYRVQQRQAKCAGMRVRN